MRGDEGNDLLDGGTGRDFMEGGAGNDLFYVDSTQDSVNDYLDQGFDTVATRVSFRLSGIRGRDRAAAHHPERRDRCDQPDGNAVAQTLIGNAGANILNGAAGNDVLTGSAAQMVFRFTTRLGNSNVDRITDYSVAADRIEIDNAVFTGLATGVLSAAAFARMPLGRP